MPTVNRGTGSGEAILRMCEIGCGLRVWCYGKKRCVFCARDGEVFEYCVLSN